MPSDQTILVPVVVGAFTSAQNPGSATVDRPRNATTPQEMRVSADSDAKQEPMTRQEVFELVRDRLADILEIEPGGIGEGDSFSDDLGADSLALIELVEELEEELGERSEGFRIEDEDLEDLKTVRDAVDYVFEKLGGN